MNKKLQGKIQQGALNAPTGQIGFCRATLLYTKFNFWLKESLKFAENEKDRAVEEKKTALDELLKLSVKNDHHTSVTRSSSRKRITSAPTVEHTVDVRFMLHSTVILDLAFLLFNWMR